MSTFEQGCPQLPLICTMTDIQKYMRLSRSKTYQLAFDPTFPVVKIGRTIRIHRDDFFSWYRQQKEKRITL